jgi:drug/metabolite transporter (DMT)-like permease
MLLAMAVFVLIDATAKYLALGMPVMQIVWARSFFALLFTLLLVRGRGAAADPAARLSWWPRGFARGLARLMATRRPGLQLMRSGFQFASTIFFFTALKYIPLADAIAIAFAAPLLITALSVPILGEQVGIRRWLAVVVGFLGVLVVIRPGIGVMEWAMLLPLCTAFTSALYQINTRSLAQTDAAATTLWYTALTGTVISSAFMPFVWEWPDAKGWALMALLGAFGTTGHFLIINAYARAPAATLAPFIYTQLVWSIGVGYALFANLPDEFTLLGAAIVAASGIYTAYRERARRAAAAPAGPRA